MKDGQRFIVEATVVLKLKTVEGNEVKGGSGETRVWFPVNVNTADKITATQAKDMIEQEVEACSTAMAATRVFHPVSALAVWLARSSLQG